jgi:hypothetical protein
MFAVMACDVLQVIIEFSVRSVGTATALRGIQGAEVSPVGVVVLINVTSRGFTPA